MNKVFDERMEHTPFASYLDTTYHFQENPLFKNRYKRTDSQSKTIRYGKVIEELDAIAGDCAYKYLLTRDVYEGKKAKPYNLVTVSVDRIDFMDKISANKDLRLTAYMMMAKGSTLMMKVDVLQRENEGDEWAQAGDAMIIFVARDIRTGKSYKVPELSSSKFDDLQQTTLGFHLGLTIKDWSREKSQRDLHKISASFEESSIYQMYLQKVDQLLCTNPDAVIKMSETERCTMSLMHGQDRNRHGKMFGGYLMKEAFDISYIAAGA